MTGRERKLKARLDRRRKKWRPKYSAGTLDHWMEVMGRLSYCERQPTPHPWGWTASLRRLRRRPSPLLKHFLAYAAAHPELAKPGGRQMVVPLYTSNAATP